jgi:hypothetical protein
MYLVERLFEIGAKEIGVGIKTNPERVREYFASHPSSAGTTDIQAMLNASWCQLFANWLLVSAGYPLLTRKLKEWKDAAKDTEDDGFQYLLAEPGYVPRRGDLYYASVVGNKQTDHMGFIMENLGNKKYKTLDGNAGGIGHLLYGSTIWSGATHGKLKGGLGGGVVCYNERHDNGGANVMITGIIKLPQMIYTQNPYK